MPETIERVPRSNSLRLFHEIAFSVYLPLLLIMTNTVRSIQHPAGNSWVDYLQSLFAGKGVATDHNIAFAILWAISAVVVFLCLRVLANISIEDVFLRTFGGIVAVAGFPLIVGYVSFRGYLRMLSSFPRALLYAYVPNRWLAVEVVACLVCIFSYLFLKWPFKARWGLSLLVLHFSLWTWSLLIGGEQSLLLFLLLGFPASIAWGSYIQQPAARATFSSTGAV